MMNAGMGYDPRTAAGQPQYDPATLQQYGYPPQTPAANGDGRAPNGTNPPATGAAAYPGYTDPHYAMQAYQSMYGYMGYPTNGYNNYPQHPPNSGNNGAAGN